MSLWARELAPMGLRLFGRALAEIAAGRLVKIPQDATLAIWEPSLDGAPCLFRPDLEMLGEISGCEMVTERSVLLPALPHVLLPRDDNAVATPLQRGFKCG